MPPLTAKKCQKSRKRGKIRKKRQKSGRFFHFAPLDRKGWLRYCSRLQYYSPLPCCVSSVALIGTSAVKVFNYDVLLQIPKKIHSRIGHTHGHHCILQNFRVLHLVTEIVFGVCNVCVLYIASTKEDVRKFHSKD